MIILYLSFRKYRLSNSGIPSGSVLLCNQWQKGQFLLGVGSNRLMGSDIGKWSGEDTELTRSASEHLGIAASPNSRVKETLPKEVLAENWVGVCWPCLSKTFGSLNHVVAQSRSCVWLFVTQWAAARQVPLSFLHPLPEFAQIHVHWVGDAYLNVSSAATPFSQL